MFNKTALLAFMCTIVLVYAQTLEEQETSFAQGDAALLETAQGPAREKRFLFKKKALGIGLGVGAGLGFIKGYKLGKLSGHLGHGKFFSAPSYTYGRDQSSSSYNYGQGVQYYPSYTQTPQYQSYQPQLTYGVPSYNDYYNNYYNTQAQTSGSPVLADGYNYNRPSSYDGHGSSISGQKSFTVGAKWTGGIETNHNAGGQWR